MPPPLSVDEALARILDGVAPMAAEMVAIETAHRRTLAEPLDALVVRTASDASEGLGETLSYVSGCFSICKTLPSVSRTHLQSTAPKRYDGVSSEFT